MNTSMHGVNDIYYIGIDLGTTHIKSAVFDGHGTLLEIQKTSTPTTKDDFGEVYDPCQLFEVVSNQISYLLERYKNITGISVTGMSEAGLIVNRKNNSEETPILPWFDRRTDELAKQRSKDQEIRNFCSTGLRNSYKYGIYKYLWLSEYYDVQKGASIWLSVCDYIVWKLTGQFATDPSFAARTYVYDIINQCWDKQRLTEYGLSENNFPVVIPSGEMVGYLSEHNLLQKAHNKSMKVCIGGHDHVCAAYAVLNDDLERICNSIGTAETYLGVDEHFLITESDYDSGLVYGPFINGKGYYWMVNISSSGQSIEWFRKKVQMSEISYNEMNEMVSSLPEEPTNILFYPYLSGIGTPHYRTEVGGGFFGLRETQSGSDMLKAIMEGINYQGKWILSLAFEKMHNNIKNIVCVGGATNSIPWMQIKANILGIPVTVPEITEATLLGAVAIMIDKNMGTDKKKIFLNNSLKQNNIYEVNQAISKKYQEIYNNEYTFLIDMIIKKELGKKV